MAEINHEIDVGLAALCKVAAPRQTMTTEDIASVCGCTRGRIEQITKSALMKLKNTIKNKDDYL